jgi:hypothetical protein
MDRTKFKTPYKGFRDDLTNMYLNQIETDLEKGLTIEEMANYRVISKNDIKLSRIILKFLK